jgi:hypothetical protein
MNIGTVSRAVARLGCLAVRQPLTVLDEHVMARYLAEQAPLRAGFARLVGSLDGLAARLAEPGGHVGPAAPGAGRTPGAGSPGPAGSPVDVLFTLPAEVQASSVALVGEFNEWSADSIRLDRAGDGGWRALVALEPGRSYRYRYLLDGERWENAWQADRYEPNPFGGTDSVVVVR